MSLNESQSPILMLGGSAHGTYARGRRDVYIKTSPGIGVRFNHRDEYASHDNLNVTTYRLQMFGFRTRDGADHYVDVLVAAGVDGDKLFDRCELVFGFNDEDVFDIRRSIHWPGDISPGGCVGEPGEVTGVYIEKERRVVPINGFRVEDRFTEYGPEDLWLLKFFGIARGVMMRNPPTLRLSKRELERINLDRRAMSRSERRYTV